MLVKREARPWIGFFVGVILGLAFAIICQQAGWWPLDTLLLFGSVGLFGLVGILISLVGRTKVRIIVLVIPLLLVVASLAYAATGVANADQKGYINGGCTVTATTPLDTTDVKDTARNDPFLIDPTGSLTWTATSPVAFKNHLWNIYVELGAGTINIANNKGEPDPNTGESKMNGDTYGSVAAYVAEVTVFNGEEIRGTFVVSGDIAGEGGMCDGLAFVRLVDDPFASLLSKIAIGLAILMLIILIIIFFRRTYMAEVAETQVAAGTAAAGAALTREAEEAANQVVDDAVDDAVEGYEPGAEDLPGTDDLA